ncbi:MAG: hypothetical protein JOZ58_03255 [Acetobacteraceae bacterium]|nr:hypothetical protein [Acetobacteraceae bacterium]
MDETSSELRRRARERLNQLREVSDHARREDLLREITELWERADDLERWSGSR